MSSGAPTPVTIACGCQKTPADEAVITEPHYSFFANLTLLFGVTAAPKRIDYRCLDCGKIIHATEDPAQIKRHTH